MRVLGRGCGSLGFFLRVLKVGDVPTASFEDKARSRHDFNHRALAACCAMVWSRVGYFLHYFSHLAAGPTFIFVDWHGLTHLIGVKDLGATMWSLCSWISICDGRDFCQDLPLKQRSQIAGMLPQIPSKMTILEIGS